jgi:hypothetical protein
MVKKNKTVTRIETTGQKKNNLLFSISLETNKKQKLKSQGYVKSSDWSATKLRDAKLGVFWLALLLQQGDRLFKSYIFGPLFTVSMARNAKIKILIHIHGVFKWYVL